MNVERHRGRKVFLLVRNIRLLVYFLYSMNIIETIEGAFRLFISMKKKQIYCRKSGLFEFLFQYVIE